MKYLLTKIAFIFVTVSFYGQHFTHDIGVLVGVSKFQTDYGENGNFASSFSNGGLSFSINHYLNFYKRNTRWNSSGEINHIMVKSELNFITKTKLEHYGKWVKGQSNLAKQLRAMHGSISMFNFGIGIEYYLKDLEEFVYPYSDLNWNPFITFGVKYSLYKNEIVSDLGDWRQNITVLPKKYRAPGALKIGSRSAFSFNVGLGTRYKLTRKLDMIALFNWQMYFSDAIDGLQPNVIENKNNDWVSNFQVGVVYHLNFNSPLF